MGTLARLQPGRPAGLSAGHRAVVNRAPRSSGKSATGAFADPPHRVSALRASIPGAGPKLTLRNKDAALRAATRLLAFPGAGGGRTLPCSPAGAARNRLGLVSVQTGSPVLPRQLRPA